MRLNKYTIATAELLLVFPACLFMAALFLRSIQPQQYEPAHTAQQIVGWFAASPHFGLWLLLCALPLSVVVIGFLTLLRVWSEDSELRDAARQTFMAIRTHLATVLTASATLAAAGILAIVVLHVLTD